MGNFPYERITVNGKTHRLHRYLMEQHLGRKLDRDEVVHHKNHDKLDNRIENLEVVSLGEHSEHHNTKHREQRCQECGSEWTAFRSAKGTPCFSLGLCNACYKRQWRARRAKPRGWAYNAGHERCVVCGTTEVKHHSKGRCYRCRAKQVRAEKIAKGIPLNGH